MLIRLNNSEAAQVHNVDIELDNDTWFNVSVEEGRLLIVAYGPHISPMQVYPRSGNAIHLDVERRDGV